MTSSASTPHRTRLTVRVRLTLWYGAMFLLAGSLLVFVLYATFENTFPTGTHSAALVLDRVPADLRVDRLHAELSPEEREEQAEAIAQALDEQRTESLDALLQQSLVVLGLVAIAAVGVGWLMASRALQPVQRITETARRVADVADRSLHERIGLEGPQDDLKELADTFDAMLEKLDNAFDSQRRFVANASHELRTPIAINRTLLEVTLSNSDIPAELREVVNTLMATNERSERLLEGLLTLARSENQSIKPQLVDLSDIAAYAVEQTAGEASAAGVTVDATPDPAPTSGDPALLERLALNLVRNGIHHNHSGGWVTVATGHEPSHNDDQPSQVELVVANSGPVVPPYNIDDLFEPFRRLNNDRTAGDRRAGLGLSIVRSIVHTHGGDVQATPRDGGGLIVRVRLRAAPTPDTAGTLTSPNSRPST